MADDTLEALNVILGDCWTLIERGARDPGSPLHHPVLATTRADGAPDARIVIVESVEAASRLIRFNTDARSPKRRQLEAVPQAVLLFFDGTTQIRARVRVTLHRADTTARRSWNALPETQRIHYRTGLAPGTPIPREQALHRPGAGAAPDTGAENYVVVEAVVTCLDWLRLDRGAGRRAVFTWSEAGHLQGQWVVP
jgi:hypothetical protein